LLDRASLIQIISTTN